MNNVQNDALLEQALELRAARTLCRDGWSCEQINAVLKNAAITSEEFETIQTQSRELDKLQKVFGPPVDSLYTGHAEPDQSEIDFLNRGPDAAAEVLREKGWNGYEISLALKDSMFLDLDEPQVLGAHATYGNRVATIPTAFPTQGRNGYSLGHPDGSVAASIPVISITEERGFPRRKSSARSLSRDAFALAFMAAFALVLVFTLL